jgi:hypothetical protein
MQVDVLLHSLDKNSDGVVSAREFMAWLVPQGEQYDKAMLAGELRRIVMEKFNGDVRALYESFKRYCTSSLSLHQNMMLATSSVHAPVGL